jgi:hypothetical protein
VFISCKGGDILQTVNYCYKYAGTGSQLYISVPIDELKAKHCYVDGFPGIEIQVSAIAGHGKTGANDWSYELFESGVNAPSFLAPTPALRFVPQAAAPVPTPTEQKCTKTYYTIPTGAQIALDGVSQGATPSTFYLDVQSKNYIFTLSKSGYQTQTISLSCSTPGDQGISTYTLQPIPPPAGQTPTTCFTCENGVPTTKTITAGTCDDYSYSAIPKSCAANIICYACPTQGQPPVETPRLGTCNTGEYTSGTQPAVCPGGGTTSTQNITCYACVNASALSVITTSAAACPAGYTTTTTTIEQCAAAQPTDYTMYIIIAAVIIFLLVLYYMASKGRRTQQYPSL